MTIAKGARVVASPCCGAWYAAPRYVSMNFAAFEYWTDGWRHGSLMPNDVGLRRCNCGRLVLLNQLVEIKTVESSDLPRIEHIPEDGFASCVDEADIAEIEVAVRLGYWRYLNHPYRQKYREHREAEEAATSVEWDAANPDRRTSWDKLWRWKPRNFIWPQNRPFTYPVFEPSDNQYRNMERLSHILLILGPKSQHGYDPLMLAELLREQGRFNEAQRVILAIDMKEEGVTGEVISKLIEERQQAPMRYRI